MVYHRIKQRIDPELWNHFQIILSRVRKLEDKPRILWFQDTAQDPEVQFLKDDKEKAKFVQKIKKEEKLIQKRQEEEQVIKENIEKQKEEKKKGKEIGCAKQTSKGRCGLTVIPGKKYCTVHVEVEQSESGKEVQCKKIKANKERCGMKTSAKSGLCYYHD